MKFFALLALVLLLVSPTFAQNFRGEVTDLEQRAAIFKPFVGNYGLAGFADVSLGRYGVLRVTGTQVDLVFNQGYEPEKLLPTPTEEDFVLKAFYSDATSNRVGALGEALFQYENNGDPIQLFVFVFPTGRIVGVGGTNLDDNENGYLIIGSRVSDGPSFLAFMRAAVALYLDTLKDEDFLPKLHGWGAGTYTPPKPDAVPDKPPVKPTPYHTPAESSTVLTQT